MPHRPIVLIVALAAAFCLAAPVSALADPSYEVMNAPEGVFWRSEPNWAAAERVGGFGVYNGTVIEVHCYQSGTAVEGSADTMWEQATDVGGRGYGSGWVNEHFINDQQPINQSSPGVGPCNPTPPHKEAPPPPDPGGGGGGGSTPPPSTPYHDGGSLYYSPYNDEWIDYKGKNHGKYVRSPAQRTFHRNDWNPNNGCSPDIPGYDGEDAGSRITTVAAWSAAKNAPFALLDLSPPAWVSQINYIILYDPGTYKQYEEAKCEPSARASQTLTNWLAGSQNHHLVVLGGAVLAGDHYRGIQHFLFADAKSYRNRPGQDIRRQIIVCPYPTLSHEDVWIKLNSQITEPPVTNINSCPSVAGVGKPKGWTP